MKRFLFLSLLALQACSGTGLLPVTSGQSGYAAIPRVILNCQSSHCRTNSTSPLINVVVTTSSCTDPLFGGVVSSSSRSISCTSVVGCYGEMSGWTDASGSTTTLPPGTYNICACINYSGGGTPWVNCNTIGEKDNVSIDSNSGLQSLIVWTDQ